MEWKALDQKLREFEIYSDKTISVENVEKAVKNELEGPRALLGYRTMYNAKEAETGLEP